MDGKNTSTKKLPQTEIPINEQFQQKDFGADREDRRRKRKAAGRHLRTMGGKSIVESEWLMI